VAELDAADASPGRGTMPGREKAPPVASVPDTVTVPEKRPRVPTPLATPPMTAHTTLSRTSGQVTAVTARGKRAGGRSRLVVAGAVIFGVVAAVLVMRSGAPRRTPQPPPVAAQPPAPVLPPLTPPPPQPPKLAQTVVELYTEPTGATVRAGDAELGTTPLRLTYLREARVLELRIEKRGFKTETLQVDLSDDFEKTVPLKPRFRMVVDPDESRKL